MSKSKTTEALEQWLGHFIALGVVLSLLLGPVAVIVFLLREFTKVPLPWIFKGQWPPGDPLLARLDGPPFDEELLTQMDRVEDLRWDSIFTLSGIAVGLTLREILVWVYA